MIENTIKKQDLSEILLPFKYNNFFIFSKSFLGVDGLFGFGEESIFFIPSEKIPNTLKIDSPESLEELQEFLILGEYISQRLMLNEKITIKGDNDVNNFSIEDILKIFVKFLKGYEENVKIMERLKHGN